VKAINVTTTEEKAKAAFQAGMEVAEEFNDLTAATTLREALKAHREFMKGAGK
jgi:hypothetical protein